MRCSSAQPAENLAADIVAAGRPAPEIYSGDISAIDAVLARPDVDAVSVVMASHIQPSVVKAALRAGKEISCVSSFVVVKLSC